MPDPLPDLEAILDAAEAEAGAADPAAAPEAPAAPDAQAPAAPKQTANEPGGDDGQSVSGVNEALELLAQEQGEGVSGPQIGSDEWYQIQVPVPDGDSTVPVSIKELVDGHMMRKDYTQKTQALARERKLTETAVEFYNGFREDSMGFARKMAEAAGLIEPGQGPVAQIDALQTSEDIEAQVEARVAEAVENHPDVIEARDWIAEKAVNEAFAALEKEVGESLTQGNRETILRAAAQAGTADLQMVYHSLVARANSLAKARADAKAVAGVKSGSTPPVVETKTDEDRLFDSFEDAWSYIETIAGDDAPL